MAPDSPALLGEKIIDENHVTIVKGEVVRVGNVLKFFNQGKELALCNPTPLLFLFERVRLMRKRHVP